MKYPLEIVVRSWLNSRLSFEQIVEHKWKLEETYNGLVQVF